MSTTNELAIAAAAEQAAVNRRHAVEQAIETLRRGLPDMTPDERAEFFSDVRSELTDGYCEFCGRERLPCYCMNDE
jgi:hypothetical protein